MTKAVHSRRKEGAGVFVAAAGVVALQESEWRERSAVRLSIWRLAQIHRV